MREMALVVEGLWCFGEYGDDGGVDVGACG